MVDYKLGHQVKPTADDRNPWMKKKTMFAQFPIELKINGMHERVDSWYPEDVDS